jgi:repressor LexA
MNKMRLDYKILLEIDTLLGNKEHPSIVKIAKWIWKDKSLNVVLNITNTLKNDWFILKDEKNKIREVTSKWKTLLWQQDVKLKNKLNFFKIPVIWNISCWWPVYAYEDIKGEVSLSEEIIKWDVKKYFILEAEGDSMNDYKIPINEWDYLLMKEQNFASNWEVVIALLDSEEATLKEFRRNDMWYIKLIPHSKNDIHKPFIITENLVIQWVLERNLGQF